MIEFLAARSGGDARAAYNALELACETAQRLSGAVTIELAEDAMQAKAILYDKEGDKHYDYISAWIKSTRGSDVDASLYYLAVMLEAGEDPRFIARRMIVLASEDIGNADPQALQVAVAAAQAVEHVGMPECALNLSQAASTWRWRRSPTQATRRSRGREPTCASGSCRSSPSSPGLPLPGARRLGRGVDYEYPHPLPEGSRTSSSCPRAWRTGATTSPPSAGSRAPASVSPA